MKSSACVVSCVTIDGCLHGAYLLKPQARLLQQPPCLVQYTSTPAKLVVARSYAGLHLAMRMLGTVRRLPEERSYIRALRRGPGTTKRGWRKCFRGKRNGEDL